MSLFSPLFFFPFLSLHSLHAADPASAPQIIELPEEDKKIAQAFDKVSPHLSDYYNSIYKAEYQMILSGKPVDYAALWDANIQAAEILAQQVDAVEEFQSFSQCYVAELKKFRPEAQALKAGDGAGYQELQKKFFMAVTAAEQGSSGGIIFSIYHFSMNIGPATERTKLGEEVYNLRNEGKDIPVDKHKKYLELEIEHIEKVKKNKIKLGEPIELLPPL